MVVHVIRFSPDLPSIETLKAIGQAFGLFVARRTAQCVRVRVIIWSRGSRATLCDCMRRVLGPTLAVHVRKRINLVHRCSFTVACGHFSPEVGASWEGATPPA